MAATERGPLAPARAARPAWRRTGVRVWERTWQRLRRLLQVLLPGLVATQASAATLPEERNEFVYHSYDGGGVKATGPALLVRKSLADRVSLSASWYVDAVSNASIDVVTTASPFKETRQAYDLGAEWLVHDTLISTSVSTSREPDYTANALNVDFAHEVFGAMTTVSLGFTRGADEVRKAYEPNFKDRVTRWQYRYGLTQVLTTRWLASLNFEAVADSGFLGSPYRAARIFGAFVPENVPRTRSSRAVKVRSLYDFGDGPSRTAIRIEHRQFWDTWDIKARTSEVGLTRYFGPSWLGEASIRQHSQSKALFYSDDAQAETLYVSRNRQLGTFTSTGFTAKATYTLGGAAARFDTKLSGTLERKQFKFRDYTDARTGALYSHNATILQFLVTARF